MSNTLKPVYETLDIEDDYQVDVRLLLTPDKSHASIQVRADKPLTKQALVDTLRQFLAQLESDKGVS